ncbi:hypothetical protein ASD24_19620 [Paenibacillus sp. Root52]|uniref:hypothetical protein n=1 Tax=Paenibacillus sp. Root52 TaxID=1736552 RepID=UPI0006FFD7AC|nr:hypothetical protein [Paenibacillus sp. Root52]KQY79550.1 hypothetical protein ASD24_19620 [Paenibacillus sp. Root52]
MGSKNEKWKRIQSTGFLKFCFLKPIFLSLCGFVFIVGISLILYGWDSGFKTALDNFLYSFISKDIYLVMAAFGLIAVINIVSNCYIWNTKVKKINEE